MRWQPRTPTGAPNGHRLIHRHTSSTTRLSSRIGRSSGAATRHAMPHLGPQHSSFPMTPAPRHNLGPGWRPAQVDDIPLHETTRSVWLSPLSMLLGLRLVQRLRLHWPENHGNVSVQCETLIEDSSTNLFLFLAAFLLFVPDRTLDKGNKACLGRLKDAGHHPILCPVFFGLLIQRVSIVRVNNESTWSFIEFCSYCPIQLFSFCDLPLPLLTNSLRFPFLLFSSTILFSIKSTPRNLLVRSIS